MAPLTLSRIHELATLGRKIAAAQGVLDDRPLPTWLAYGRACQDALARGRPVPVLQPLNTPAAPPPAQVDSGHRGAAAAPPATWLGGAAGTAAMAASHPAAAAVVPTTPVPSAACRRREVPEEPPSRRRSFHARVVKGLLWRYGILFALVVVAQSQAQAPWLVIGGVLGSGLSLGLWRRRSALARLWRTLVIAGGAVYVAPLFAVYPGVLVGSIGALTVAPFVAGWRRR